MALRGLFVDAAPLKHVFACGFLLGRQPFVVVHLQKARLVVGVSPVGVSDGGGGGRTASFVKHTTLAFLSPLCKIHYFCVPERVASISGKALTFVVF